MINFIITGASQGIGYHTAMQLAKDSGHRIFAIARNEEKLYDLAKHCYDESQNNNVFPILFDLSNIDSIGTELVPRIRSKINIVDILINNAGYLSSKPFREIGQTELLNHFKVNFFSVYELIRQTLDLFDSSSMKHIVNIGTMGAVQGSIKFKGMSAYISSKAALANLTESLAAELQDKGIKINYLALGGVETKMFREAFRGQKAPHTPGEMAEFISDFALNSWKYFNGKILSVTSTIP